MHRHKTVGEFRVKLQAADSLREMHTEAITATVTETYKDERAFEDGETPKRIDSSKAREQAIHIAKAHFGTWHHLRFQQWQTLKKNQRWRSNVYLNFFNRFFLIVERL